MEIEFERIVDYIRKSPKISMSNEEKLEFYKFYKQATCGDCNTPQPMFYDFEQRAKWDAWNTLKGYTPTEAKLIYITMAKEKIGKNQ